MKWEFKDDRPIYLQIAETVKTAVVSGEIPPGERLSSVRELAAEAGVNPNTMQKALFELERSGLVFSSRTSGRFVTADGVLIASEKQSLAREKTEEFVRQMDSIGIKKDEIIKILSERNDLSE